MKKGEEIIKVLEVTPKYKRVHQSYPEFFDAINSVMRLNRLWGINKSMSDVIKDIPKELRKYIKSGRKFKNEGKLRGLELNQIIIDEVVPPKKLKQLLK